MATSWRKESIPQGKKGNKRPIMQISAHHQGVKNQSQKAKVDNKKFYDIVTKTWIIECPKMFKISNTIIRLNLNCHGKLGNWISTRKTNIGRSENSKMHLPMRLTLATVMCYNSGATHLFTKEIIGRLQICKLTEKDKPLNVYVWYEYIYRKWKRTSNIGINY